MARSGRPERNRAARSFRQLRRFHHVINSNKVFQVSRVASALVAYVPSPLPRWSCWVLIAPFPSSGGLPCEVVRSASTLLFSKPAQRLLTLQPTHSPNRLTTLSIEGFRRLVALPSAPIATGWSEPCREGFAPSQELCLSTAHDFITTTPVFRFSVRTRTWMPIRVGHRGRRRF